MSTYTFRPSIQEAINKSPIIAFAGPTGSGKTESAMRLARGYVGPNEKFCIIDTEERRALYKKERYQPWDHLDLKEPFSPENYQGALDSALKEGYKAVIIDSWSHEWAGYGGVTDMADQELKKMVDSMGADKASKLTALAWSGPKQRHKKVMNHTIIRFPALLIFCLRAERKVKFIMENGKQKIVDAGFLPICEKGFMFEMLVACMMEGIPEGTPGVPLHIKQLEKDLEPVFIKGEQVNEETGRRLAEWAAGGQKKESVKDDKAPLSDKDVKLILLGDMWKKLSKERKLELKKTFPEPFTTYDMDILNRIEDGINTCLEEDA
jgi:DNA polymerase III delta prime subunit